MRAVIFDVDHTLFVGNKLHEGVADLLVILERLGITIGALSSNDHRVLVRLDEAGIRQHMKHVLCTAHMPEPKAPSGVRRLLQDMDAREEHAVLISHAHADIALGKAVGLVKVIGVTHGLAGAAPMRQAGADHVVDTVPAVLDVLE
jgi:phosphoglycolate phosphatase-like HAD superfamily hydrolase